MMSPRFKVRVARIIHKNPPGAKAEGSLGGRQEERTKDRDADLARRAL